MDWEEWEELCRLTKWERRLAKKKIDSRTHQQAMNE